MLRRRAEPEPRLIETVALGVLQGPAELLPVSSSAHVELLPWLLGWRHAALPGDRRKEVEVALHAGSLVALAAARGRAALARPGLLVAATAPPALAGLLFEGPIERRLGTPASMAAGLLAGSAALLAGDRVPGDRGTATAGAVDGLCLGVAQVAALAPGVSRSGATRAMAGARGFTRTAAAELSADVALPIIAGATALKGTRLAQRRPGRATAATLAAGALAAVLSTAAALRLERRLDVPASAWAAYRCALAGVVLAAARRRRGAGGRGLAAAVRPLRENGRR